jgi:hypothetical protein
MLDTIRRNWWFAFFAIGILIAVAWPNWAHAQSPSTLMLPFVTSGSVNVQESTPVLMQYRIGHGIMTTPPVDDHGLCMNGAFTDLVPEGKGRVVIAYDFADYGVAVVPTVKKVNGKDESYIVSFGQDNDYLAFQVVDSKITATHWQVVDGQPVSQGEWDLSTTSVFLQWKVELLPNNIIVKISRDHSTIWIADNIDQQYFCTDVQTPSNNQDDGILPRFITMMTDAKLADYVYYEFNSN